MGEIYEEKEHCMAAVCGYNPDNSGGSGGDSVCECG